MTCKKEGGEIGISGGYYRNRFVPKASNFLMKRATNSQLKMKISDDDETDEFMVEGKVPDEDEIDP